MPVLSVLSAQAVNQILWMEKVISIFGGNQPQECGFYLFVGNAFGDGHLITIPRLGKEANVCHHDENLSEKIEDR